MAKRDVNAFKKPNMGRDLISMSEQSGKVIWKCGPIISKQEAWMEFANCLRNVSIDFGPLSPATLECEH